MPPKRASKSPKRTPAKSPADEGLNGGYWGTVAEQAVGPCDAVLGPVVAKAAAKRGKRRARPARSFAAGAHDDRARARAIFPTRAGKFS